MQGADKGSATLTVQPDDGAGRGPAGSQLLVYTFQDGQFVNLEIMWAVG